MVMRRESLIPVQISAYGRAKNSGINTSKARIYSVAFALEHHKPWAQSHN